MIQDIGSIQFNIRFEDPYYLVLYSRTQLIAVSDNANVLKLRLRVRLIGTEKR